MLAGGGQGLTEVTSTLTNINKRTFGAIWLPDWSQTPLRKLRAQARQVQESLYPIILTYYPYTKTETNAQYLL